MKKKLENIVQDIYKAIKPLSKGDGLDISEEESMKILQEFFGKLQAEKSAQANEAGAAYLAENAAKILSKNFIS